MSRQPHLAATLVLVLGIAGCRHKTVAFVLPLGMQAPAEMDTLPLPDSSVTIASLPLAELAPMEPPPEKPVIKKKPTPKEDTQPPVQVASSPEPAMLAIGALTTGGDAAPQSQQQAREMIASIRKRIAALQPKANETQKRQIRQISHFLDQAQQAMTSGDAEGAKNLATKAGLLMDDLEKK